MIPPFNHNFVIPPNVGNPAIIENVSPYICDIMEFCNHFSTSKERVRIMKGFVEFRLQLVQYGVIHGFQWIDGSFTENVEEREKRAPNDIDVVTFFKGIPNSAFPLIQNNFPEFISSKLSKQKYLVDHYPFQYDYKPELTVQMTKYWCQLFSHNRKGVWKGILQLPLYEESDLDKKALNYLNSL